VIRVNLLPHTREQRSAPEASQLWLVVIMGVVVLEIVGLFFFHQTKEDQVAEIKSKVSRLENEINDIRGLVKDHTQVKDRLSVLRAREEAIAKLQAARKGPTAVLMELSKVLSAKKGPTIDEATAQRMRTNPNAVYNPTWDTRRLWVLSFVENQRSVRLDGKARDGTDVYEFAQRLKLSRFFSDITLLPGKIDPEKDVKVDLVSFALQVKAKY
jgi:type IV pilus assembly protein PilN